jgi:hypothetical protein
MARESVERLCKRISSARAVKEDWRSILSDAYEYAQPNRNLYKTGGGKNYVQTQGQKKVDRVFDSTAISSTMSFANRIQSDLMPPFQRWVKLTAGPAMPEQFRDQANALLEIVNEQLFSVLQASNFDTAINEFLMDLAIGTGVMFVLEGDVTKPVMFAPISTAFVMLEEGAWGDICGIMWDQKVMLAHIEETWPDVKNMPTEWAQMLENDPTVEVDLISCAYKDPKSGVWYYEVIYEKVKARIVEREYESQPVIATRWLKLPGEVFGRGPVIQALPDIKTINKLRELVLKNAALQVAGVYTGVNDGVFNPNTAVIRPGGVIPVASNGGSRGPSLMALDRTGAIDIAGMEWDALQMSIRQMLFDDRLPPESGAVRSATEIVERVKELAKDIGAPFGRLMSELITPLIQRVLAIMDARGLLPQKLKVDGLAIQVQVISPLAQIQNINDVESVVRWLSLMAASLGPQVSMLSAKMEDIGPWFGEKLGVPTKLIRPVKERAELKAMAGAMAAEQVKAQQAATIPANANAAPPIAA